MGSFKERVRNQLFFKRISSSLIGSCESPTGTSHALQGLLSTIHLMQYKQHALEKQKLSTWESYHIICQSFYLKVLVKSKEEKVCYPTLFKANANVSKQCFDSKLSFYSCKTRRTCPINIMHFTSPPHTVACLLCGPSIYGNEIMRIYEHLSLKIAPLTWKRAPYKQKW